MSCGEREWSETPVGRIMSYGQTPGLLTAYPSMVYRHPVTLPILYHFSYPDLGRVSHPLGPIA